MSNITLHDASPRPAPTEVLTRARHDPAYAAFWLLRIGFVVLPLWMGIDKFAKVLNTDWPGYLAPWIVDLLPFSATPHLPLVSLTWTPLVVMTLAAAGLVWTGLDRFARRDVQTG